MLSTARCRWCVVGCSHGDGVVVDRSDIHSSVAGAGIPAVVGLRAQRRLDRKEWRERFDAALALVTHEQELQRQVGEVLLADLIRSDLGTGSDRDLAQRVATVVVVRVDADSVEGDTGSQSFWQEGQ